MSWEFRGQDCLQSLGLLLTWHRPYHFPEGFCRWSRSPGMQLHDDMAGWRKASAQGALVAQTQKVTSK